MTRRVVLWNAREAKEKCEQFTKSYAQLRSDLLDHLEHKGHVALKYADDWDGFFLYCREKLKIELKPETIRLQISTAQVSREVGVDVPMVITRHLAKLPPGKQKEVYDEVIGAREVAGQRSANQMEPDVRRVVRRELGVIEPTVEPVSITSEPAMIDPSVIDSVGINNTGTWPTAEGEITLGDGSVIRDVPRTEDLQAETANRPANLPMGYKLAYSEAWSLLSRFITAYAANNQEELLATYTDTRAFILATHAE